MQHNHTNEILHVTHKLIAALDVLGMREDSVRICCPHHAQEMADERTENNIERLAKRQEILRTIMHFAQLTRTTASISTAWCSDTRAS